MTLTKSSTNNQLRQQQPHNVFDFD